ncbi:hypothetical protein A3SI_06804 [Nitritalea halalkaliphila LW7]|uniref:Uncharacterized protein n=1 Tax=Nitritalea halalkaliphila LW7 TaxID=1189621 RepID=I5C624_9BACT|nr:hypothetical protein [Nitritalea halalkaliphila]EIM77276.1 hypothetical protein A3SI_06804 [Nitritalea halalkaliphila LW7]
MNALKSTLWNWMGVKVPSKIIVIESDDWGAMRMRDKHSFTHLIKEGFAVDRTYYNSLDCLENKEDLQNLFSVIGSFQDFLGAKPVFTFNTVLANPDFERIAEEQFEKYYYRDLFFKLCVLSGSGSAHYLEIWYS